jgi:uncharacterized protein
VSTVRARLNTLRRQSGGLGGEDLDAGRGGRDTVLREQLQRVGAGRRKPGGRARISEVSLAARLGGQVACEGVIRISERLSAGVLHGDFPLLESALQRALPLCAAGAPARACVFMDTETTGLSGGSGTLAFLLGMARFCGDALELNQLLLTGFQGEAEMLGQARAFLVDADALVTFNGRSFDGPLLAARYRLAGLADPFAELEHVDLLHATRRSFKHCWPDCRLQTVEQRLLGVRRVGDLPGCEAPQAWFDWVRHGHDEALAAVCAHNRQDLLSLAVLPVALERGHEDPRSSGANVLAWARHARRGRRHDSGEEAAFAYLERHRALLASDGLLELARLARRRGDWQLAVALWEQLAGAGEPAAIEHLAKYFEHEQRDYARAAALTARLLADAPGHRRHQRRAARLRARLSRRPVLPPADSLSSI